MSSVRSVQGQRITPAGFFVLRTPLLPVDDLIRWSDSLHASEVFRSDADSVAVRLAWQKDIDVVRARLREIVDRPEVRQALLVASPSLESSINHWAHDPDSKKGLQTERSIVRYFARMVGRATPFGLFSGCSMGTVADGPREIADDELRLESRANYRVKNRLDYYYMCALASGLQRLPSFADELRYWPNSSLHLIGDVWHYVETTLLDPYPSHHLVEVHNDSYICEVLERARTGARIPELMDALLLLPRGSRFSRHDAREYVQELVNAQVLVSSLSPLVTGQSPLDDLIGQLAGLQSGMGPAETLRRIRTRLAEFDGRGLGIPRTDYEQITSTARSLTASLDSPFPFQVDMMKPFQKGVLSAHVIDELVGGVEFLCATGASPPREPGDVRAFREAFSSRYGQVWMPFLQVLDEDVGIGFGRHLPSRTSFIIRGGSLAAQRLNDDLRFNEYHAVLLRKVVECASSGASEILLQKSDFPARGLAPRSLPGSFMIRASIGAPSIAALREGDFRLYLRYSFTWSGTAFLARFCSLDAGLTFHVRSHLRDEETNDKDAVYADIVYLPEGRAGNVLYRPVLRNYEIEYLGRSGASTEQRLPISDLLVKVTGNGEIVLRSRHLGKRVIPRLTAALDYTNPRLAPVYRFLGFLQYGPQTNVPIFDWGPLATLESLPRVRVGRVVFSPAQWRIMPKEMDCLTTGDRCDRFIAVQELRDKRRLPRWVLFVQKDNTLPVDLDNPLSVDAFGHILKRAGEGRLVEMYPGPGEMCVTGPEGHFHHELTIPFLAQSVPTAPDQPTSSGPMRPVEVNLSSTVDRHVTSFPPASEWAYIKLYAGPATLDEVLSGTIPSLVRAAFSDGLAMSWFFVRYADPEPHLRIRFHGEPKCLTEKLLPLVTTTLDPFLSGQRIWKMELSTYEREIERYGGLEGTAIAEEIFCADSEAVLAILQALDPNDNSSTRSLVAIMGIDRLLGDCGLVLSERREIVRRGSDSLRLHLRSDSKERRHLDRMFREQRTQINALLDGLHDGGKAMAAASEAFQARSAQVAPLVRRLRSLDQRSQLSHSVRALASSFVHMHVNRVLRFASPQAELPLYHLLFRAYCGRLATIAATTAASDRSQPNSL